MMPGESWVEQRHTCLAYSPGGHRAELIKAIGGIQFASCFHVTFDDGRALTPGGERTYLLTHPCRSLWRTLVNALEAFVVLIREKPSIIISTGADVSASLLVLGRLMGCHVIFIETGGTITPSLTGRLVYPFAHLFIVQWPEKLPAFPRATLSRGPLL